jgi:hypothetical protein
VAVVSGEIASNAELREAWRKSVAGTLSSFRLQIVARAVARGELPEDGDAELLSMLPLTLLQTWRLERGHGPDDAVV